MMLSDNEDSSDGIEEVICSDERLRQAILTSDYTFKLDAEEEVVSKSGM